MEAARRAGADGGLVRGGHVDAQRDQPAAVCGRRADLYRGYPGHDRFYPGGQPRPAGGLREIKYLVIHETDNFSAGADASAHNSFIHQNANAEEGIVSWHYTVDDHEIYHHLPDSEPGYHAGDRMDEDGGNERHRTRCASTRTGITSRHLSTPSAVRRPADRVRPETLGAPQA